MKSEEVVVNDTYSLFTITSNLPCVALSVGKADSSPRGGAKFGWATASSPTYTQDALPFSSHLRHLPFPWLPLTRELSAKLTEGEKG